MFDFRDVLAFWFEGEPLGDVQIARWWKRNEVEDQLIKKRFAELVENVHRGFCDEWLESPEGWLAAIISLDQFPRNIYRNQARSFKYDQKALSLTQKGLQQGHEKSLNSLQQAFFVMPLMHSENLQDQEHCVELFGGFKSKAPKPFKGYLNGTWEFAVKHRDIVARFNRFPHRNEMLGRASTAEELVFLLEPGSSF